MRKLTNQELNRPDPETFRQMDKIPVSVVLDNVRSLHNVGSVFRTCDAFLIEKIYLCGITGTPPNKEIRKTALGAEETVAWSYFKDTLSAVEILKKEGYSLISIEQAEKAVPLQDFTLPANKKTALVFGHEVQGVGQEVINLSDAVIEIPQLGTKHSLNVAVSAGIVVWEVFRKLKFAVSS